MLKKIDWSAQETWKTIGEFLMYLGVLTLVALVVCRSIPTLREWTKLVMVVNGLCWIPAVIIKWLTSPKQDDGPSTGRL